MRNAYNGMICSIAARRNWQKHLLDSRMRA
jgi:hypothetical protein